MKIPTLSCFAVCLLALAMLPSHAASSNSASSPGTSRFDPRQTCVAHPVVDFGERMPSRLGNRSPNSFETTISGQPKILRLKIGDKTGAIAVPAIRGHFERQVCERAPEAGCLRSILGRQHMRRPVPRKFLGRRPVVREVEDQNLKTRQRLPNRLIIMWGAGVLKMIAKRLHEGSHVIVGRPAQMFLSKPICPAYTVRSSTPASDLAFASAPSIPFAVSGAPMARDSLATEASFVRKRVSQ